MTSERLAQLQLAAAVIETKGVNGHAEAASIAGETAADALVVARLRRVNGAGDYWEKQELVAPRTANELLRAKLVA